jgi:methylated-DNA-[protein]-cysteine S-methyltransferase
VTYPEKAQLEIPSPLGPLFLEASSQGLSGLSSKQHSRIPFLETKNPSDIGRNLLNGRDYLGAYFKKELPSQSDLKFDLAGTPFQVEVWRALLQIPYGKTISYKDLAHKVKSPRAFRAVGSANGKNPLFIIVPCHRVIAADGSLGGYSGGTKLKQYLLKLEGVDC